MDNLINHVELPAEFKVDDESFKKAVDNLAQTFKASFTLTPNYIWAGSAPSIRPITISAEHTIDNSLLYESDQNSVDHYIKCELARKIAKQLVDEDLIQIQTCDNIDDMTKTMRATIKIIQE